MAARALAFPPWLRHGRGALLASLRRVIFLREKTELEVEFKPSSARRHGRGPRAAGRECARAALRFRSQSKIAAQARAERELGDSAGARPPAEHAVWHSEVKRKGVAGGVA
jgi:hypothetical protein